MAEYDFSNLTVQARLVPDRVPDSPSGAATSTEQGADALEIGVEIEGVWVPFFYRRSAVGLLTDIERVKQQAAGKKSSNKSSRS